MTASAAGSPAEKSAIYGAGRVLGRSKGANKFYFGWLFLSTITPHTFSLDSIYFFKYRWGNLLDAREAGGLDKRRPRKTGGTYFQMKRFFQIISTACFFTIVTATQAADLTVFAAASLTDSLKHIAADYQKQTGHSIAFNFEASSVLARCAD